MTKPVQKLMITGFIAFGVGLVLILVTLALLLAGFTAVVPAMGLIVLIAVFVGGATCITGIVLHLKHEMAGN